MEKNGVGVRRGAWTKEEDFLLKSCIEKHGEGKWHQVPLRAGLNRCRKSCRLRWMNYLRPDIKRGYFTNEEVDLIARLHKLLGNRWSLIAGRLPGRTANDVKNFWNTRIASENCRRPKTTEKTITTTTVIKPRPRTLTMSKLQAPHRPNEANDEENLKNKQPCLTNDENRDNNQQSSTSSAVSQDKPSDGNPKNNEPSPSSSSQGEVDECIRWWSSLLEIAETGEGTSIPIPNDDDLWSLAKNDANQVGFGSFPLDVDVWGD